MVHRQTKEIPEGRAYFGELDKEVEDAVALVASPSEVAVRVLTKSRVNNSASCEHRQAHLSKAPKWTPHFL